MAAVSSRAFRLYGKNLTVGTTNSVPMMLPLIDMCNHSFHSNARIVQEQDAGSMKLKVKVKFSVVLTIDGKLAVLAMLIRSLYS